MTIIYLIRHGETMWNREKRLQGHIDIGLNDAGYWQAECLAKHMAGKNLAAVISSDLSRAIDTAKPIAEHHELDLIFDPALRERHYGIMQGLSHQEIADNHPRNHLAWKNREVDFQPESGESLQQFYNRVVGAVKHWAGTYPDQEIAVVAHGGVLDCLYRASARMALDAPRTWQLGNAAINRVLFNGEGFVVIGWNDHGHLEGLADDAHA